MTVLLFYQEITHDAPTGFYEAPDDMIVRLTNDWLKAWPYGQVIAMTDLTFWKTTWYKAFLERGWGRMKYQPDEPTTENSNVSDPPISQPSNQHGASVPESSVGNGCRTPQGSDY